MNSKTNIELKKKHNYLKKLLQDIDSISYFEIYENEYQIEVYDNIMALYHTLWSKNNITPKSKFNNKSSIKSIANWLIETAELTAGKEYVFISYGEFGG